MRRILYLSLLAMSGIAGSAQGQVSYEYVTDLTTNGGIINATAGQVINVNLYLQETLANGATSLITADGGLYGATVKLTQSGGTGTINAGAASFTNSAFSAGNTSFYPGSGLVTAEGLQGNVNTARTGVLPTGGLVLIGTEQIIAAAGSTTYTIGPATSIYGPGATITFNNGYDLDSTNNANQGGGATYTGASTPAGGLYAFTVDVAAVPEPSSVILTGVVFAGLAIAAWQRRREESTLQGI